MTMYSLLLDSVHHTPIAHSNSDVLTHVLSYNYSFPHPLLRYCGYIRIHLKFVGPAFPPIVLKTPSTNGLGQMAR